MSIEKGMICFYARKKKTFNELPFIGNFDKTKTDFLLKISGLIKIPERYILTKQFEPSHSFS